MSREGEVTAIHDSDHRPVGPEDVEACLRVLAAARAGAVDPALTGRLDRAVSEAHRAAKKRARARRSALAREHDQALVASTTRHATEVPPTAPPAGPPAPTTPAPVARPLLGRGRHCYVCKLTYRELDADYHHLCPDCARVNREHRVARCDLRGRRALVTGGRIKIGFHTVLKLLRDGAEVLVTTRFPRDAARRYARVADFDEWSDRLHLHGVDLLDLDGVLDLVATVGRRWDGLDILVNNAAQTLHRPAAYHRAVRAAERDALTGPAARLAVTSAPVPADTPRSAQLPARWEALFPAGRHDETGEPLDLRPVNSWVLRDGDVSPEEWLRVHVVNAFAPFLLTSRLRPLLEAADHPDRYVVQVSATEGNYSRPTKTHRHPHTNMAKAALNMYTRTVAADYRRTGIFMNSVDTGWITDERPHPSKTAGRAAGFRPPLDVLDGAARVYDPIVRGVQGQPVHGQFLKDYRSVAW